MTRFARLPIASLVLAAACGLDAGFGPDVYVPDGAKQPTEVRVLFIGNSLTYVNDLPGILEALADSAGLLLRTGAVTAPDFSLSDHWVDGAAVRTINRGGWNWVAMQQGPSALQSSRDLLIFDVERYAQRIRGAGAEPAIYQVWPAQSRSFDFDRSLQSYAMAADTVGGLLLPAGTAMRAARTLDPSLTLYADDLHPNTVMTYLTAMVMLNRFTGHDLSGLPLAVRSRNNVLISVSPALQATLRQAAITAVATPPAPARRR